MVSNKGVPQTDEEAKTLSPDNYFEFHLKLQLPTTIDPTNNNNNNNNNMNNTTLLNNSNDTIIAPTFSTIEEMYSLLKSICQQHQAHLSSNAFKRVNASNGENTVTYIHKFVTQRMYGIGKQTALQRFEDCINTLKQNGFLVVGM